MLIPPPVAEYHWMGRLVEPDLVSILLPKRRSGKYSGSEILVSPGSLAQFFAVSPR